MHEEEVRLKKDVLLYQIENGYYLKPTEITVRAGSVVGIGEIDLGYHEQEMVEIYPVFEMDGYYILKSHIHPESTLPEPNMIRVWGDKFKEVVIH
ncbi:MAG: hypothetical protein V4690_02080 [Patescibacteria group bacterium]